ncbi:hypothetical protein [Phocaeicola sp.]|uniref:hypothetical protein n=1 Tax=Phocaeicola sp. TaxID=2773926 RepID=UPI0023C0D506|nr:hypothetical protein [Phocaeicola sp.]MDE5676278.1 hypothetical protein [Phocaeicola sp.]
MDKKEQIWTAIARMHTPGFFITALIGQEGEEFPAALQAYIGERLAAFRRGVKARKFVFRQGDWRIYLTFFPTDRVVEEGYALKNSVMKTPRKP